MIKASLNGIWELQKSEEERTVRARVPGTVVSAYLARDLLPDGEGIAHPYYRNYEEKTLELFQWDYSYSRKFEVSEELLSGTQVELVCFGIDTLADIWLNGQYLAYADNMHRTWRLPCRELLRAGENEIRIELKSPLNYISSYKTQEGKEVTYIPTSGIPGNQFIRKSSSMFGWDWGIMLPDMGIWRGVELWSYASRIADTQILQKHEAGRAELELRVWLSDAALPGQEVELTLTDPEGEVLHKTLSVSEGYAWGELILENPRLWWPNGYGEQPLYQLELVLKREEEVLDERRLSLGLRTLTVSREKDAWGSEFAFVINGVKIFTRGANYIPEDAVYPWITQERIRGLIGASVKANFNCLRVWGGGYYPSDEFYELCDRYGLIVWQDLMYACNIYEFTEEFERSVIAETIDNVRRIRHHACLGLWCGNNEMETGWVNWEHFKYHSGKLRADYIKQFEYVLPRVTRQQDSQTFYWPSSPSSGGCFDAPDDENRGDVHYWDVWHGQKPFRDYEKYHFRFCSEFGFQSFPGMKTIKAFTEEADRNIFSRVMEVHQKNPTANGKILSYLSESFLYPKNFESILYVSQILQGLAIKFGVEHWRRHRGRCMGSLYWQLNDNWPVASWSSIDYFGRWKALHYMAKTFYAPLAGSIRQSDTEIEVHVQNESLHKKSCYITISLMSFDFKVIAEESVEAEVPALTALKVYGKDYGELVRDRKESCFLRSRFSWKDGYEAEEVAVFVPYKYLLLQRPDYRLDIREEKEYFEISIASDTVTLFTELDLTEKDAVFSDNYFPITDAQGKKVLLFKSEIKNNAQICDSVPMSLEELKEQLKVFSLRESYE